MSGIDFNLDEPSGQQRPPNRYPLWVRPVAFVLAPILAIVLIALVANWSLGNGVTNELNNLQNAMTGQYQAAQVKYSSCDTRVRGAASVAKANADAVTVLIDAAKGGYDNVPLNQQATQHNTSTINGTVLLGSLQRVWPDTASVSALYKDVLTILNGCRSDFGDAQIVLLSQRVKLDDVRTGTWKGRHYSGGFPSKALRAQVGPNILTGEAAYNKMGELVTTAGTRKAYETGIDQSQDPFPGPGASPSPSG